jgi:hypothetical protein
VTDNLYNPLDKLNLGKSVAEALLDRPPEPLGTIEQAPGAGIYAIYYKGDYKPYHRMAEHNAKQVEWPIYIGKAIPSGGRKGADLFRENTSYALSSRLRQHADTIRAAENLRIDDFVCRYLIVDDIWIPLGETLLISAFRPVWNLVLDGFGNHDPGSGRYGQLRSPWDVLHPGRHWALKCREPSDTAEELAKRVRLFLRENQPPTDTHMRFKPPAELTADDLDL